jgi:hypothetical protein
LVVTLVVAPAAQAPRTISDSVYVDTMKEIGLLSQQFRENLEGGTRASAARDAARLQVLFGDVLTYWEARRVRDAMDGSRTAVAAAAAAVKALTANDLTTAGNAQKTLQGTCRACHMAHRERLPDGTYRFK